MCITLEWIRERLCGPLDCTNVRVERYRTFIGPLKKANTLLVGGIISILEVGI